MSTALGARRFAALALGLAVLGVRPAAAQPTPGYPERVLQWVVQSGQTCREIAASLYGSETLEPLLSRYNDVDCGSPLAAGRVLVVPEKVAELPAALLEHATPQVKARPPDGDWQTAAAGLTLFRRHGVNTLEDGTADILFGDRSRIFLAEHTLVIIYRDAPSSLPEPRRPVSVQLDAGELQAGIDALRGIPAELATSDGGLVEARSRDTVLRRSGDQTTVSVFEGTARVHSAGAAVPVAAEHGTRFRSATPPEPPRPLPPAPRWTRPPPALVLAPDGHGTLTAGWAPIATAKAYRLELARDRDFHQPLVREEVPPDVLSFHAEALPPGPLYSRVRAIDADDFLGLSSAVREVVVVAARLDFGALDGESVVASPYATLRFELGPELELSIDGQPYRSGTRELELWRVPVSRLTFRETAGRELGELSIEYRRPRASLGALRRNDGALEVLVHTDLTAAEAARAGLRLSVRQAGQLRYVELKASSPPGWLAAVVVAVSEQEESVLELEDVRGVSLAIEALDAKPAAPRVPHRLAPPFAVLDPSPSGSYEWWQPLPIDSAGAGVTATLVDPSALGWFAASAAWGPLGISGRIVSDQLGGSTSDDAAWLGARLALSIDGLQTAVGVRAGLPVSASSPPTRIEPSLAIGSELGSGGWLVNVGSRLSLDGATSFTPRRQLYAIAGGTRGLSETMFAHAALDGALSSSGDRWCGGARLGIVTRTRWAAALSLRVSPCSDGGRVSLQAGITLDGW